MLYSGTMNNFLGSEPILIRTLGPQPVLKTDNFLRWLQRKDPSPPAQVWPCPERRARAESREPRSLHPAVLRTEAQSRVGARQHCWGRGAVPAPRERQ